MDTLLLTLNVTDVHASLCLSTLRLNPSDLLDGSVTLGCLHQVGGDRMGSSHNQETNSSTGAGGIQTWQSNLATQGPIVVRALKLKHSQRVVMGVEMRSYCMYG